MSNSFNKSKIYGVMALSTLLIFSCEKIDDVNDISNFDIHITNIKEIDPTTGAYVVNLADNIEFEFVGEKVDNILFYSGTIGEEYKYRNRWIADEDAMIKPQMRIKTAVLNTVAPINGTCKYELGMAFDKDIPEYTDNEIANTNWKNIELRKGLTNGNATTQYFNFNDALTSSNGTSDYTDWFSHQEVAYCVRAKSNIASQNRFQLQEFYVSNTETRDYSYTYGEITKSVKKTKEHVIFKDYSILDNNLKVTNSETAACWGMYTPQTTIKEGETNASPNSQHYAFNAAELGLKYGEYTGSLPWTTTNKFGQTIRGGYNVEIWIPNQNIRDKNGNPILDNDGKAIVEPTQEMMNEPCESWIVSRKHNVHQVKPDIPTTYIKNKVQSMTYKFSYNYAKKGSGLYIVTFYINNQNTETTKEFIKEFKILVK